MPYTTENNKLIVKELNDSEVSIPAPESIVGVPVHPIGLESLLTWMTQVIAKQQQATVMYANAYAVNLARGDQAFLRVLK